PKKTAPDLSFTLLCPMPGLLVSLAVNEGDEVVPGQSLCVVEAMKMENVLKADRKSRIDKIRVKPGDVLSVDDVIMDFAD
ncbi:MAG: acetyl/propionyl-CoA carboxylase subunit alpha, partial [Rhodobacteraceae bacterium]|nr:acetyl/propionyl-CoA carboxylase subunit alpha [Paracoccaceae bacterium]